MIRHIAKICRRSVEEVKDIQNQASDRVVQYAVFSRFLQDQLLRSDLESMEKAVGQLTKPLQQEYEALLQQTRHWLKDEASEEKLRVEYAHLFLLPQGVKPFESVYTSREKLMKQEAWQRVRKLYHENGFQLEEGQLHPEDHVSVELAFMSCLIETESSVVLQKRFFEEHLQNWIPELLTDVKNSSYSVFYQDVAEQGLWFLQRENQWLKSC